MRSEYETQARNFLRASGAKMSIVSNGIVQGFPFDDRDRNWHNKYLVRIDRCGRSYSFPFYDSAYNTERNVRPTQYDILACLEKYPVEEDVWDFAEEYGYEIHCRKDFERVTNTHRACKTQYEKLLRLFGEELMAELQQIA